MAEYTLHLGDCLEYMKTLPDGAVSAVVTDPPYGIAYDASHDKYKNGQKIIATFTNGATTAKLSIIKTEVHLHVWKTDNPAL